MFDYQGNNTDPCCQGAMVPDVIRPGNTNFCNTKPPLAAWALQAVAAQAPQLHPEVCTLLPAVLRYRSWWLQHRVTPAGAAAGGLLQFGASSRTPECMRWESGMDNAPRFDRTLLTSAGPQTFVADQFSVDLAAHTYNDWRATAQLATLCGDPTTAKEIAAAAEQLKAASPAFFSKSTGFMHDRHVSGDLLPDMGGRPSTRAHV
jgi:putative isomerase